MRRGSPRGAIVGLPGAVIAEVLSPRVPSPLHEVSFRFEECRRARGNGRSPGRGGPEPCIQILRLSILMRYGRAECGPDGAGAAGSRHGRDTGFFEWARLIAGCREGGLPEAWGHFVLDLLDDLRPGDSRRPLFGRTQSRSQLYPGRVFPGKAGRLLYPGGCRRCSRWCGKNRSILQKLRYAIDMRLWW